MTRVFINRTPNNTVGGTSPADRNLISANQTWASKPTAAEAAGARTAR